MILIIDGDYTNEIAHMAGVILNDYKDKSIAGFITADTYSPEPYESGSFYKRELVGVEAILDKLNISEIELIIIDGFAKFNDGVHKSLGEHVYEKYYIPVIGVAKKWCEFCKIENTETYRGNSKTPLFVTVVGGNHSAAKRVIEEMYGENRLPYAIKLADSIARKQRIVIE